MAASRRDGTVKQSLAHCQVHDERVLGEALTANILSGSGGLLGTTPTLRDYRLPGDEAVYHLLNNLDWAWLNWLSRLLSNNVFDLACVLLIIVYVFLSHRARTWVVLALTLAAITLSDRLGAVALKPAFARQRPCYALAAGTFHQREPAAHTGSLPSLHASNAFAAALPLAMAAPEIAPAIYALATLIALSRVQLGVHWPSDILAGAVIGTLIAMALIAVVRREELLSEPRRST
jgi:undecaprenyl-diphosphatase